MFGEKPPEDPPDYTPRAIGPVDPVTGDLTWIAPILRDGGGVQGDHYISSGRVGERIFPSDRNPADWNHYVVGRIGLRHAWQRLWSATARNSFEPPANEVDDPAGQDPLAQVIVALYEALEWIHSLHEHLHLDGKYSNPSDLDPIAGQTVSGLLGARNASHHGMRRVVGVAETRRVT
ncbi:hypothetical protein GCM10009616_40640 [Microlunatus lacustris]